MLGCRAAERLGVEMFSPGMPSTGTPGSEVESLVVGCSEARSGDVRSRDAECWDGSVWRLSSGKSTAGNVQLLDAQSEDAALGLRLRGFSLWITALGTSVSAGPTSGSQMVGSPAMGDRNWEIRVREPKLETVSWGSQSGSQRWDDQSWCRVSGGSALGGSVLGCRVLGGSALGGSVLRCRVLKSPAWRLSSRRHSSGKSSLGSIGIGAQLGARPSRISVFDLLHVGASVCGRRLWEPGIRKFGLESPGGGMPSFGVPILEFQLWEPRYWEVHS